MSAQSLMSVMMPKRRPEMIYEVVSYAAKNPMQTDAYHD